MSEQAEIIDLTASRSLIDVRGGGFDLALVMGGQPIALNWSDCEGSVAQYLARAGRTDCESELRSLRHTLAGHWLPEAPISSQIYPFIELMVPGRYELRYVESCPDCSYIEFDSSWDFDAKYDHYYPFGSTLVLTRATDSLSQGQVTHYLERIRSGYRPIALTVTASEGWCNFVLDGHHKLRAYKMAGVKPAFVSVCRLDAPRVGAESFDKWIGANHPMASRYRKVKTKYDT
ncbi:hypothetical protein J8F10_29050 [Gemmata sp. G18]|uniref:ParB/Sulfiredoxin domain-containing protein n=1 Tax=Gemmata palustris TaxID=2822762 RepID=A0ABS5C001_9BACT|nr:hypothetical protein [Gemmata palustris]MBP3959312.1 hypothetical protein [Gemmata palustris]